MPYSIQQMAADLALSRDAKFQKGIKMTVDEVAKVVGPEFKENNENPPPSVVKVREEMEGKSASKEDGVASGKKASNSANAEYLDSLSPQMRSKILMSVAKHYGTTAREIERELRDRDAEALYEYLAFDKGMAMQVYQDFRQMRTASKEEAKFEEGQPADPTVNMSPEDKKKWEEENAKHKDQFKGAASPDSEAEADEDRAEADEDKAQAEREEAEAARTKESGMTTRVRLTWKTAASQVPGGEGDEHSTSGWKEAPADAATLAPGQEKKLVKGAGKTPGKPDGTGPCSQDPECECDKQQGKTGSKAATGLYGYTRAVQADCEASVRKLQRKAASVARAAWNKDERVAEFLTTHAKRGKSRSARVLLAALKEIGPKVASDKTAKLMSRQEKVLKAYLDDAGARAVMEFDNLPLRVQSDLRRVKDQETLHMDVNRWLMDNNNHHLSHWAKDAGATTYGMYGFPSKTARLGLSACTDVKDYAGTVAADLHRRRASLYEPITGFLTQHAKEAKCLYSNLILGTYPDASIKIASTAPDGVEGWLNWEE